MRQRSAPPGKSTSEVEVTNVSSHGFWLVVEGEELFLPFAEFPWFRGASIDKLTRVERPRPGHLYWPELDIDISEDSIRHPEKFPLVSRKSRRQGE